MIKLIIIMQAIATVNGLFSKQIQFINSDHPSPCLVTGYGYGKTYSIINRFARLWTDLIKDGEKNPFLYNVGLTSSHNELVVMPEFEKFFKRYQLNWKYYPNSDKKWYKIQVGDAEVTIKLLSAHNPERIVGFSAHHGNIDELDILPFNKARIVWDNCTARSRLGKNPSISATSTPEGFKYLYWLCVRSAYQDNEGKLRTDKAGNEIRVETVGQYIQAQTKDNTHLSPEYINNLKRTLDPKRFEAYTNGTFVNFASGQVFEYFNDDMVVDLQEHTLYGNYYTFWDFGWRNPTYIGFCKIDENHNIYIYNEIMRTKTTTEDIIRDVKQIRNQSTLFDYCDPAGNQHDETSGLSDIKIMRSNQLNPKWMTSRIQPRIKIINNLLSKGKIKIHPRCRHMIDSFRNSVYPEPVNGVYDERPLKDGVYDHARDAFGYLAINHFKYEVQEWRV